jgi:hypothetical protein
MAHLLAAKGNRNVIKHGGFTAETITLRREIAAFAREWPAGACRRESKLGKFDPLIEL